MRKLNSDPFLKIEKFEEIKKPIQKWRIYDAGLDLTWVNHKN
jgi:hypothetical protein